MWFLQLSFIGTKLLSSQKSYGSAIFHSSSYLCGNTDKNHHKVVMHTNFDVSKASETITHGTQKLQRCGGLCRFAGMSTENKQWRKEIISLGLLLGCDRDFLMARSWDFLYSYYVLMTFYRDQ